MLFVVAAPVMLLVALAVRAHLARPGHLSGRRASGKDGGAFTIFKFRTMQRRRRERRPGPVLAARERPARHAGSAASCAATRLDELPQLWNVLRGDMSFVGPRPERPEFVDRLRAATSRATRERFKVRPGLTGYAQVNGEYHTSAATKLKYDLAYIHNRSLWLDLKILSETVKVMLTRRGV